MFRMGYDWKIEYSAKDGGLSLYSLYFWDERGRYWYFYRYLTKQEAERY